MSLLASILLVLMLSFSGCYSIPRLKRYAKNHNKVDKKGTIRIAGPWHSESGLDRNIDPAEDSYVKKIISSNEGINFNKDMAEAGEEFEANGIEDFYDKNSIITYEINGHEIPVHLKPKLQPETKPLFPEYVKELPTAHTGMARYGFQLGDVPNRPSNIYANLSPKDLPEYQFKDTPSINENDLKMPGSNNKNNINSHNLNDGNSLMSKMHEHIKTPSVFALKLPWKFATAYPANSNEALVSKENKPILKLTEDKPKVDINNGNSEFLTENLLNENYYSKESSKKANNKHEIQQQKENKENFDRIRNADQKENFNKNSGNSNEKQQNILTQSSLLNIKSVNQMEKIDKNSENLIKKQQEMLPQNNENSYGMKNTNQMENFDKNSGNLNEKQHKISPQTNESLAENREKNVNNFSNNINQIDIKNLNNRDVEQSLQNKINSNLKNSPEMNKMLVKNYNYEKNENTLTGVNDQNLFSNNFRENSKLLKHVNSMKDKEVLKGFMDQEGENNSLGTQNNTSSLSNKMQSMHQKLLKDEESSNETISNESDNEGPNSIDTEKAKAKARILNLLGELTTKLKGMEAVVTEQSKYTMQNSDKNDVTNDLHDQAYNGIQINRATNKDFQANIEKISNGKAHSESINGEIFVPEAKNVSVFSKITPNEARLSSDNSDGSSLSDKTFDEAVQRGVTEKIKTFMKEKNLKISDDDKSNFEQMNKGARNEKGEKEETSNSQINSKNPVENDISTLDNSNKPFIMNTESIDYQGNDNINGIGTAQNENVVAEIPTDLSATSSFDLTQNNKDNEFQRSNSERQRPSKIVLKKISKKEEGYNKVLLNKQNSSFFNSIGEKQADIKSEDIAAKIKVNFPEKPEQKDQNKLESINNIQKEISSLDEIDNMKAKKPSQLSSNIQKESLSLEDLDNEKYKKPARESPHIQKEINSIDDLDNMKSKHDLDESIPESLTTSSDGSSSTIRTFKPSLSPEDIEYPDYNEVKDAAIFETTFLRRKYHANKLQWSDSLSDKAQKQAEILARKLDFDINKADRYRQPGENIALVKINSANVGKEAVDIWGNENKNFDFKSPLVTKVNSNFVQMMWKADKNFGMGVAKSRTGSGWIVTAFYDSPMVNNFSDMKNNIQPEVPIADPYSDIAR